VLAYPREVAARRKRLSSDSASQEALASKDDVRAIAVMVERLESSVRGLAEGMTALREGFKGDLDALEQRLSSRISVVEEVVRKNSDDIRKNSDDIRKNSDDIRLLRIEVAELRLSFGKSDGRMHDLERRLDAVEARLNSA
jgi:chromosome segregation ATPase